MDHPRAPMRYENLPPEDAGIRLAPAPRYRPGHPFYKFATINGNPAAAENDQRIWRRGPF